MLIKGFKNRRMKNEGFRFGGENSRQNYMQEEEVKYP